MTTKKDVAIIYGGQSGEHEVSCRSAHFLHQMLRLSYHVTLIGVTKSGMWYWQTESCIQEKTLDIQETRPLELRPAQGIFHERTALPIDCVFPIIHGNYGEDGRLQALLDIVGIPYAGCNFMSSTLCMNKGLLKTVFVREGIPTLPFISIFDYEFPSMTDADFGTKFKFPNVHSYWIVKPSSLGSSLGISKISSGSLLELKMALQKVFELDACALVEPFGQFREIECSVIGSENSLKVFPAGEVIYSGAEYYDYETKYGDRNPLRLQVPAKLSTEQVTKIEELARRAYAAGRCEGFARIDFFIEKNNCELIYVNEINTLPGFTKVSLFPKMCLNGGMSLELLGETLIQDGIQRFRKRRVHGGIV